MHSSSRLSPVSSSSNIYALSSFPSSCLAFSLNSSRGLTSSGVLPKAFQSDNQIRLVQLKSLLGPTRFISYLHIAELADFSLYLGGKEAMMMLNVMKMCVSRSREPRRANRNRQPSKAFINKSTSDSHASQCPVQYQIPRMVPIV